MFVVVSRFIISWEMMVTVMDKIKILCVEDNHIIQKFHQTYFNRLGYEADWANNTDEAMRLFYQNNYDLIITDFGLPNVNAICLAKAIRNYEAASGRYPSKIYALTNYKLADVHQHCTAVGINAVFNKPIPIGLMLQLIRDCEICIEEDTQVMNTYKVAASI